MGLDVGGLVNGACDRVCGSPAAFRVLRNPVYTALLITALALVVVYAVLRDSEARLGLGRWVRLGLGLAVTAAAALALHYSALRRRLGCEAGKAAVQAAVGEAVAARSRGAAGKVGAGEGYVRVVPGKRIKGGRGKVAAARTEPAPRLAAGAKAGVGDVIVIDVGDVGSEESGESDDSKESGGSDDESDDGDGTDDVGRGEVGDITNAIVIRPSNISGPAKKKEGGTKRGQRKRNCRVTFNPTVQDSNGGAVELDGGMILAPARGSSLRVPVVRRTRS
jgi:hypothetical protein